MFKCHECDRKISGEYMVILGDALCMDCAEQFMEDELDEMKMKNPGTYREALADVLGLKILEV